ncbi:hypothetical protein GLYMA_13G214351v4 [Glycine max]|nr:hypothetical protein GLYMA_13G214351v4 [Glycine max]KAH1102653.1 hypothetical protein GYH30_036934 [Glycine max]
MMILIWVSLQQVFTLLPSFFAAYASQPLNYSTSFRDLTILAPYCMFRIVECIHFNRNGCLLLL